MMTSKDVTIVIRSSRERTEKVCRHFAELQVPAESIFVIHERPFREAVAENFRIGLAAGKRWTLAIDADVLLRENAVIEMIEKAEPFGESLFIYQGFVLDKLFNNVREGGPHLYQTKHLNRALQHLTQSDATWRPESDIYKIMAREGFTFYVDDIIYGVHDYEQYYRDIYRKAFFHARKHRSRTGKFVEDWTQSPQDLDLRIALQGLVDGLLYEGDFLVDSSFFNAQSRRFIEKENIKEKDSLVKLPSAGLPSHLIQQFEKTPRKKALYTKRLPKLSPSPVQQIKKILFHYPGRAMEEFGHMLQNFAR